MPDAPKGNGKGKGKKPLCFVIGPIGKDGSLEKKHSDLLLHAVIKQVLQQDEFGYHVKRADEDADPGMIGDRMITDIINSELVIADLTDLNPNAFYELGIRHATEKPTIHIAKMGTVLPFDNVTHRTIFVDLTDWHSIEQARNRLAESTRAITAPDYKVSNPITQANASFKMRQSEDPRDRVLAEMQERMAVIEGRVSGTTRATQDVEYLRTFYVPEMIADALVNGRDTDAMLRLSEAFVISHADARIFFDKLKKEELREASAKLAHAAKISAPQAETFVTLLTEIYRTKARGR